MMAVGIPIVIERIDDNGNWAKFATRHCTKINQSDSKERHEAGADRTTASVDFEFRWSRKTEAIRFDTSQYRVKYRGGTFNVEGYDDFMERHETVRIKGVSYDG